MKRILLLATVVFAALMYVQVSLTFPAASWKLASVELSPAFPFENEEVVMKVEVTKLGPAGTCTVVYFVDNKRCEENFKIRGTPRYVYLIQKLPAGVHYLHLENENKQWRVKVTSAGAVGTVPIEIESFKVEPVDVKLWETFFVKVRVRNKSTDTGWATVRLWVDNEPIERRVLIGGGRLKDICFRLQADKPILKIRVENCPQPEENLRPSLW